MEELEQMERKVEKLEKKEEVKDEPPMTQADAAMKAEEGREKARAMLDTLNRKENKVKVEGKFEVPSGKNAVQSMKVKFENKGLPDEFAVVGKQVEIAFRIINVSVFMHILDMLATLCTEVRFVCTTSGLLLQTMDNSQVVLVDLALNSDTLKEYTILTEEKADTCLAFRLQDMLQSLKLVNSDCDVYFRKLANNGDFQARYIDGTEEILECGWFNARLVVNDNPPMPAPTHGEYIGEVKMNSQRFSRIISQLAHIGGETMHIECKDRTVIFSVNTGSCGAEVICKDTGEVDSPEYCIVEVNTEGTACKQSFALKFLQVFSKATIMSKRVIMKFSEKLPFCVTFPVDGKDSGHVMFHLAPKVDDGDDF